MVDSSGFNTNGCFLNAKFEGNPRFLNSKRPIELVSSSFDYNPNTTTLHIDSKDKSFKSISMNTKQSGPATIDDLIKICSDYFDFKVVEYNDMESASYKNNSSENEVGNAVL